MKSLLFIFLALIIVKSENSKNIKYNYMQDIYDAINNKQMIQSYTTKNNKQLMKNTNYYNAYNPTTFTNNGLLKIYNFTNMSSQNFLLILKKKVSYFILALWKYKDKFFGPSQECIQLDYINDMVIIINQLKQQHLKDIKLESCSLINDISGTSNLPYYNIFNVPEGHSITELCMEKQNCRHKLGPIAKKLLKAIAVLNSGENSLFQIGNINVDSVFYKDLFGEEQLYISNMTLNYIPENNMYHNLIRSLKPWSQDMNDIGLLLLKALSQKCDLVIEVHQRTSSLDLYLLVQTLDNYQIDDIDLGVPIDITHDSDGITTYQEKEIQMEKSIYDFIFRLQMGPNQFLTPDEALNHPFLTKLDMLEPTKPSDMKYIS